MKRFKKKSGQLKADLLILKHAWIMNNKEQ